MYNVNMMDKDEENKPMQPPFARSLPVQCVYTNSSEISVYLYTYVKRVVIGRDHVAMCRNLTLAKYSHDMIERHLVQLGLILLRTACLFILDFKFYFK